jgi:hypothetical protein
VPLCYLQDCIRDYLRHKFTAKAICTKQEFQKWCMSGRDPQTPEKI